MKGGRKASAWNMFVKKVYQEGHSKNSNYSFKQALQDASKRKSEMNKPSLSMGTKKSMKGRKSRKNNKVGTRRMKGGKHIPLNPSTIKGGAKPLQPASI